MQRRGDSIGSCAKDNLHQVRSVFPIGNERCWIRSTQQCDVAFMCGECAIWKAPAAIENAPAAIKEKMPFFIVFGISWSLSAIKTSSYHSNMADVFLLLR